MEKKSFTLIELLIVIAIIGILSAIIIISTISASDSAADVKKKADINQINKLLMMYDAENGGFPIETTPCQTSLCSTLTAALIPKYTSIIPSGYTYQSDGSSFTTKATLSNSNIYTYSSVTNSYTEVAGSAGGGNGCDTGWIEIPGTNNCVMKYEAKIQGIDDGDQGYDSSFIAESRASGTPWQRLNQENAKYACDDIGAHLITNAEWMTIAKDIENNASQNQDTSNAFYVGHTNDPQFTGNFLSASTDDNDGFYLVSSTPSFQIVETAYAYASQTCDLPNSTQRRTFKLSNGETIWDFSGNLGEWTDNTIDVSQVPITNDCVAYSDITDWKGLNQNDVAPLNINGLQVGFLCEYDLYDGATIGAYIRGSNNTSCATAGLYSLTFWNVNSYKYNVGFRCVKSKSIMAPI